MSKKILFIGFVLFLSLHTSATTWGNTKHKCPVCNEQGTYQEVASYGGYIYQWFSKYQYVFWPLTDFPSVYSCLNCHFSTYMWDFDSIPQIKIDTIKTFLSTVKLDENYKEYYNIPMITRLEIAEKIYQILGRDTDFWCEFYRVMGYHYADEKNEAKSKETRLRALNLANEMVLDTLRKGQKKENLLIIAAMYNYTEKKDSALIYLDKAGLLTYQNSNWTEDEAKGLDEYLTDLIQQYKSFINKKEEDE